MNIIIPAAGRGTRLEPLTLDTPKVLLPVAGKPIIGHIFDRIARLTPEAVTLVTNPRQTDSIREYLAPRYPLPLQFVEQPEPLGLGHAVLTGLHGTPDAPVLILLGDTIFELDLAAMTVSGNSIGVRPVADPRRFGVVEIDDGRITSFVEKPEHPKSNLAIVGIYSLHDAARLREALDRLVRDNRTTRGEFQLTDALQAMVEYGTAFKPFPVERWLDCGTVDALLEANRHLLNQTGAEAAPVTAHNSVIIPPVFIDPTSRVAFSTIGPYAAVGPHAAIEHSVVRDSIVDADSCISHAVVEHTFVGRGDRIAGTGGINAGL